MKKTLIIFSFILFSSFFLSGCTKKEDPNNINLNQNTIPTSMNNQNNNPTEIPNEGTFAAIETKDGQIVIKLYEDKTPNTVANFIKKADSDFYNGLIFHRVIDGFMAQGGDPLGTGTGGGDQPSEINNIPFVRGSLGLARGPVKEVSNDSQFFICFTTEQCQHLTGDYVNFGEVVSGLDILDKVVQGDQIIEITSKTK
jgi:cyclophilin family peptidyl-prolyl cis-trans isomerase